MRYKNPGGSIGRTTKWHKGTPKPWLLADLFTLVDLKKNENDGSPLEAPLS